MAFSRGFPAEDLNSVRLPGSVDVLVDIGIKTHQELYAIWNSASISGWVCVEVGLDGTKKLITAVSQHALNCFAQVLTSPLGGSREVVSPFVL